MFTFYHGTGLWSSDEKVYKNAIPNEQYLKLSAQLHNRIPGDTKYLEQSERLWRWFRNSGMFNDENLINDGLHECRNNGQETWTYNQGVVLGALVELYRATDEGIYIDEARKVADAVLRSTHLNDEHGVLYEPCTVADCGPDAPCFKGIFIRFLKNFSRLEFIFKMQRYLVCMVFFEISGIWANLIASLKINHTRGIF